MRLLLENKANEVIEYIDELMMTADNPFQYNSRNTRILSGEEEGVFSWIAVNYLLGTFNNGGPDDSQ